MGREGPGYEPPNGPPREDTKPTRQGRIFSKNGKKAPNSLDRTSDAQGSEGPCGTSGVVSWMRIYNSRNKD